MTQSATGVVRAGETGDTSDPLFVVLRRRFGWVVAGLIVGIALAAVYISVQPKLYTSTASASLRAVVTDPFAGNFGDVSKTILMENERVIARSAVVAQRAQKTLKTDRTTRDLTRHLNVVNPPNTQILSMSFSADTPRDAQAGANAFVNAYLAYRQAATTTSVARIVNNIQIGITSEQQRRDKVSAQLAKTGINAAQKEALNNELATILATLSSGQQSVDSYRALDTTPGAVTQPGSTPIPASRSHTLLLIAGGLIGLVAGLIAARVREMTDPRIWRVSEVGSLLGAVLLTGPLTAQPLALIRRRGAGAAFRALTPSDAEGFRSTCLFLLHRTVYQPGRGSLAIVSPRRGEGRTQVTARLAMAAADLGHEVLAVSADFVRPGLNRFFSLSQTGQGLASVLAPSPTTSVDDGFGAVTVPERPNLAIVADDADTDRAKVLSQLPRMNSVIMSQSHPDRVVLVDTPAVFEAADALVAASSADAALVVVAIGKTTRADAARLQATLSALEVSIVGVIPVRHVGRLRLPRRRSAGNRAAPSVKAPLVPAGEMGPVTESVTHSV